MRSVCKKKLQIITDFFLQTESVPGQDAGGGNTDSEGHD